MAVNFISKGESDLAALKLSISEQNTEVVFKNRFGRNVIIRQYEAKKMVRRGEGTIVEVVGELRKTRVKKPSVKAKPKFSEVPNTSIEELNDPFEAKDNKPVFKNIK